MDLAQEISGFCKKHGLVLNTNLGQHFLIDEEILNTIVTTGDIHPDDHIVEIGPGIGVLTRELLKKAKTVTTIEIDANLIPLLEKFTATSDQLPATSLKIIQGNALEIPFPNDPYKIVANIPYHITSPLLRHAYRESEVTPQSMTLLMQKEVAQKICDTADHGLLTILVGLFGKPSLIRAVPPEAFLPPPKVDSAVLHIESFAKPLADAQTIDEVFRLTKIAFSQKRKMLRNTIGELEGGMELLQHVGIEATCRPQTLSVAEWIQLAQN